MAERESPMTNDANATPTAASVDNPRTMTDCCSGTVQRMSVVSLVNTSVFVVPT